MDDSLAVNWESYITVWSKLSLLTVAGVSSPGFTALLLHTHFCFLQCCALVSNSSAVALFIITWLFINSDFELIETLLPVHMVNVVVIQWLKKL